ncbi:MAG: DUF302 domain-containing protein [bacterium]|nr:DUF302 domain-containing protein [bacterium]
MRYHIPRRAVVFVFALILAATSLPATTWAGENPLYKTRVSFEKSASALEQAIKKNKMGLVSRASAQRGAASIGVKIKGNQVIGVYRPDFAVRMLKASVPAGIEAPIRIYIYENGDGTATITYKKPSDVFRPYGNAELDKMAAELDVIFDRIVRQAAAAK